MQNEINNTMGKPKTEYEQLVDYLARERLRDELMFQGIIKAKLKEYEEKGIALPIEQLISDIKRQVGLQREKYDIDESLQVEEPIVSIQEKEPKPEIVNLSNEIDEIFDPSQVQSIDDTVPKATSFESVLSNDNLTQENPNLLKAA